MWHKIVRWTIALLILAVAAGGSGAWYVWVRGDHYARQAVYRKLSEIAPACRIEMQHVSFDWESEVLIENLAVGSKSTEADRFLNVPEMAVQLNRQAFMADQTVRIERIRLVRPHLKMTRRIDGTWTFRDLLPLHVDPDMQVPAWDIQDATLTFQLAQPDAKPIVLTLEHADFLLTPTGRRQLSIEGRSRVADAGPVTLTGEVDLAAGTWSLRGSVESLSTSGSVAGFAWNASAAFRASLAEIEDRLAAARESLAADRPPAIALGAPEPVGKPRRVQTASNAAAETASAAEAASSAARALDRQSVWAGVLTRLGIDATLDVAFAVSDAGGDAPLDYELHLTCRDGQIAGPLLPFPLSDLRGEIDWDQNALVLRSLSAHHNQIAFRCDGEYRYGEGKPTGGFTLKVDNLVLGQSDIGGLPPGIAKCLAILRPRGPVDITGRIERDADGRWAPHSVNATVGGASVLPAPFPYPVTGITGTIRQSGPDRWAVDLEGDAGTRPIECHGHFTSRAAGSAIEMTITGQELPIDQALLDACKPKLRRILQQFHLAGVASGHVELVRQPGAGKPIRWGFHADVSRGALRYDGFPYAFTDVTGEIGFDSVTDVCVFHNVRGTHDGAVVTAEGRYIIAPPGPIRLVEGEPLPGLDLSLSGRNVPLDDDLREALPQSLRQAWDDLRPGGVSHFNSEIVWVPGYRPDVELTRVEIRKGRLNPIAFPYPMESVIATARFVPWRTEENGETSRAEILIDEFVGWHDGMRATADSSRMTLGTDRQWELDLRNLRLEDFRHDEDLRRAVPDEFRKAIETLDPRGVFLVEGQMTFTGRGEVQSMPDVAWDLTAATKPDTTAALSLGTPVSNVSGQVSTAGRRRDGQLTMQGVVDLDQATALGQVVTDVRGRFSLRGDDLVVGSLKALPTPEKTRPEPVPPEEQFRGDLFGGLVTLSAHIQLGDRPTFRAFATLAGGSLEKYVAASIDGGPGQLAGVMNGRASFWGDGMSTASIKGHGELNIVPASLYRLPAIMQIFQAFSFAPPNGPAFSSARLDYTIHDAAFHFQPSEGGSIVLSGETLRLVGGGRVGFDRVLDLEFYSTLPNNPAGPLRNIPILKEVVGGLVKAATTGWVKVVVKGRASDPYVNLIPLPGVPETWRNIMSTLGPRRPAQPIGFRR